MPYTMIDIAKAEAIEVIIEEASNGTWRLWVNGHIGNDKVVCCLMRAYGIKDLSMRANNRKLTAEPLNKPQEEKA
jgi:hypothetical protein